MARFSGKTLEWHDHLILFIPSPLLPFGWIVLDSFKASQNPYTDTIKHGGVTMAENRTEDYFDETSEGHEDTREDNFECDNPDPHLGCDLGIDVQG